MKKYYTLSRIFSKRTADKITTNHVFSKVTLIIFMMILLSAEFASAQGGPDIDVWYGDEQTFGQHGIPQPWVNILGNVSDADGIASFYYTLNGGSPVTLSIGPNNPRLQSSGDFNIDLATSDLEEGANTVIITAIDNATNPNQTQRTITVIYTDANIWPLPYNIDWQSKAVVNDVSQAVDGKWGITEDGIHTVITGYDRLVAIGDEDWDDYEVTVPVTIHNSMSTSHGVGLLLRWPGHSINGGASCDQPQCGYLPLGAICWYRGDRMQIYGNGGQNLGSQTRSLDLNTIYIFKARVETIPGVGGLYSFKVWKQGDTEPVGWDLTGQEEMGDPQKGCLLLICHHGDVTFGDVAVTSIPIRINNVKVIVHSTGTSATISWNTNKPASSKVAYGETILYELGEKIDTDPKTSHSIELDGLIEDELYHYKISSKTAEEDEAVTEDKTFISKTSGIVSDDFHLPLLDSDIWTFIDPVGDCSYNLSGSNTADAWLNFDVPAETEHQLYQDGIQVPHVIQDCEDVDFEVEAKFESPVILQYQEQGILVQQDEDTFLRFEFFSSTSGTHVYAASIVSGVSTQHANIVIDPSLEPMYMKVTRQSNQWTMDYSMDGDTWQAVPVTFNFDMTVTGIGPYAGNALGDTSPAFTGSIDYFFNTASPVVPEDPISLNVMITSMPETAGVIGQLYTYDVEADGTPAPTYSLLTAPIGMTIDVTSGLIEWYPYMHGDFDVSVQASNTIPSDDIQNFVIHVPEILVGPVSDDFNNLVLDESIWSFVDPLEDGGEYTLTETCTENARINITVPGIVEHQLWNSGIMAPHILQPSEDTDFELEVKFESALNVGKLEQGILVKEDDDNFLRFEFYSNPSETRVIAVKVTGSSGTVVEDKHVGTVGLAPLYMRVKRIGNQWTQYYSTNGTSWDLAVGFEHLMVVSAVGTYAGNYGSNPPAHTSSVDYFFNTAAPVIPEDGPCTEWIGTTDNDWSKASNWSNGVPLSYTNVTIPSELTNQPHITAPSTSPSQCNRLNIESGASVTIDPGKALTVYRTLTNNSGNNGMLILSDATGTGSLIEQSGVNGSVDRYLTEDEWHYVSAPVDDPTAGVFLDMYMMEWDEPSGLWSYISDENYIMAPNMKGYAIWSESGMTGNNTVSFDGNLNTGSYSINVTNQGPPDEIIDGFNLVGNPYASSIDWDVDDGSGWYRVAGNIDLSIYYWLQSEMQYGVYVKDGGSGTFDVDNIIPPHQGFLIHCSTSNGTFGVDNGARIHASKDIYKNGGIAMNSILKLQVKGNNLADEVIVQINPLASIKLDQMDALKLHGSEEAPQLYSISKDNNQLSINSFPVSDDYNVIPIGLEVGSESIYTISVSEFSGFDQAENILLEDLKTGVFTKLESNCTYSFTSSPLDDLERFLLHLNGEPNVPDYTEEMVNIYSLNKVLYIEVPQDTEGNILVYNIMGQEIASTSIDGELNNITIEKSAYYVVKVVSDNGVVAIKVLVR